MSDNNAPQHGGDDDLFWLIVIGALLALSLPLVFAMR